MEKILNIVANILEGIITLSLIVAGGTFLISVLAIDSTSNIPSILTVVSLSWIILVLVVYGKLYEAETE